MDKGEFFIIVLSFLHNFYIMNSVNNLLNPVFRQMALKGENKVLYKAESVGEFILSFDGMDPQSCMIRNKISQIIFELLAECGVKNHFIKPHGLKEQNVVALEMLPFIVDMYTSTNEDLANRLHCAEGIRLKSYLIELKMKDKTKEYPIISKEHILNFEWVNEAECNKIYAIANRAMDVLYGFFRAYDCTIKSMSLEFGRAYKDGVAQGVLLADEMSPKNISFIVNDMFDLKGEELYLEMAKRLGILKYE